MGFQSLKRIIAAGRHNGVWVVNEADEAAIGALLVEIEEVRAALKQLPGQILNLRCFCAYPDVQERSAYEAGHRAARYEAADLVSTIPNGERK